MGLVPRTDPELAILLPRMLLRGSKTPQFLLVDEAGEDLSIEVEGRNITLLIGQNPHLIGPVDTVIRIESTKDEATTLVMSVPAEPRRTAFEMNSRRARSLTVSEVQEPGVQPPSEEKQMIPRRFDRVQEVWFALLIGASFFILQRALR